MFLPVITEGFVEWCVISSRDFLRLSHPDWFLFVQVWPWFCDLGGWCGSEGRESEWGGGGSEWGSEWGSVSACVYARERVRYSDRDCDSRKVWEASVSRFSALNKVRAIQDKNCNFKPDSLSNIIHLFNFFRFFLFFFFLIYIHHFWFLSLYLFLILVVSHILFKVGQIL